MGLPRLLLDALRSRWKRLSALFMLHPRSLSGPLVTKLRNRAARGLYTTIWLPLPLPSFSSLDDGRYSISLGALSSPRRWCWCCLFFFSVVVVVLLCVDFGGCCFFFFFF